MKRTFANSLFPVFVFIALSFVVLIGCKSNQKETAGEETKPAPEWYTSKEVAPNVYQIDDHGGDNIYLIIGQDSALIVDTGMGIADLKGYISTLTDLPYRIVITHGHPDHAGGNFQFDEIYGHPKDSSLIRMFESENNRQNMISQNNVTEIFPDSLLPVYDKDHVIRHNYITNGFVFDLGGRQLEVLEVPGHTPGSICLIDKTNKLLFAGDTNNSLVWLFLNGCRPLDVYLTSLEAQYARAADVETVMPGHGEPLDIEFIAEQIQCVKNILDGSCEPEDYNSFAGTSSLCKYKRAQVAYNPDNLTEK